MIEAAYGWFGAQVRLSNGPRDLLVAEGLSFKANATTVL